MYRALMNQPLTGRDDLISRAVAIGLDMVRFERDLNAAAGAAILERDMKEGDRFGIRMTPTTFINGKVLSGRQTLESIKERVDAILSPASAKK
jgi:protein-disulfide isomerase